MPLLGLCFERRDIDALFDSMDPDASGAIEFSELNAMLRRGATAKLDPELLAGGAGQIALKATTKHSIRKTTTPPAKSALESALASADLQEGSGAESVAAQIHELLSRHAARVVDLFRDWDEDGSGTISRREFRRVRS